MSFKVKIMVFLPFEDTMMKLCRVEGFLGRPHLVNSPTVRVKATDFSLCLSFIPPSYTDGLALPISPDLDSCRAQKHSLKKQVNESPALW